MAKGNFLRAFVDTMVDTANLAGIMDASVTIVKPIRSGSLDLLRSHNCVYSVLVRGVQQGQTVEKLQTVHSVKEALCCYEDFNALLTLACEDALQIVVSNTTEAGIVCSDDDELAGSPPNSYPAKLTRLLWERYLHFEGAQDKGLYILPCELIADNARELERCVLYTAQKWALPEPFLRWIKTSCYFCTTLVDCIVTGYDEKMSARYHDPLLDVREPFALWVIEEKGDIRTLLPLDQAGLPVVYTHDVTPYRERKVRILNGAHTAMALMAYLAGKRTVRDCMEDDRLRGFINACVYDEIIPTLPLDSDELARFAKQVFERFENPFLNHRLLSISLNSVSKFRARLLGTFKDYYSIFHQIPRRITFAFAALVSFYCDTDVAKDDASVLAYFAEHKNDSDFINQFVCKHRILGLRI